MLVMFHAGHFIFAVENDEKKNGGKKVKMSKSNYFSVLKLRILR